MNVYLVWRCLNPGDEVLVDVYASKGAANARARAENVRDGDRAHRNVYVQTVEVKERYLKTDVQ